VQKWLRKPQRAHASAPQPSPPALNCICRASSIPQSSVHVPSREGRGLSGSQREGNRANGSPLHSPPCTLLPPNRWPTMAHGRHLSTPGLVRGRSIEGGGRRWRCDQTLDFTAPAGRGPPPPRSHPAHPPTVQPQLLRAGPQGNRGRVGAGCGQRAPRNLIPAAPPLPCGDLAARTLPLSPHRLEWGQTAQGAAGNDF